jgi:ribosomal protein S8
MNRNQIILLELKQWYYATQQKKIIISFFGLLRQLAFGWDHSHLNVYYYYKPSFLTFIKVLQQKGYIESYCILSSALFDSIYESRQVVVFFLPTQEKFLSQKRHVYVHFKKNQQIFLTYEQVLYVVKHMNHTFLFHTNEGLLVQEELLKKKIGGLLVCSLL